MSHSPKRDKSRSGVQQAAEALLIEHLSLQTKIRLAPKEISAGGGRSLQVDAFGEDEAANEFVIAEAWAHVGKAKSAQRNKVMADMLKLHYIAHALRTKWPECKVRSYLVFADEAAAEVVSPTCWAGQAAVEFGIEAVVARVDEETKTLIRQAQKEQDIRYE